MIVMGVNMKIVEVNVQEMYNMSEEAYQSFLDKIDESLNPRSHEMLYDKFSNLMDNPEINVLDAGCRDARHLIELAERHSGSYKGIDIVEMNIKEANQAINEKNLEERIDVRLGDLMSMPYEKESFDLIWCRDVLGHMDDLKGTFDEFYRVLKPGGKAMIFLVTSTELLTDDEADFLCKPLATYKENIDPRNFEEAFKAAGFKCIEKDIVASEWREFAEETGRNISSKQLMRIAKLTRNKEAYIKEFGETLYAVELSNCYYGVYQMFGKLCPIVYTIEK